MFTFILFGTGWRSDFYRRIARALPNEFPVPAVYTRHEERIKAISQEGFFCTSSMEEALSFAHDAVIVASGPAGLADTLEYLQSKGENIITETSYLSLSDEDTKRCSLIEGFAMEQYPYYPVFKAVSALLPRIGKVQEFRLSMLHNHHAAAMMRKVFPQCIEGFDIKCLDHKASITKTDDRHGRCTTGESQDYTRKIRILTGKGDSPWLFVNDFSTNQYHTYLIPSSFEIRGEKGVLTNTGISYADEHGIVISDTFRRHFDGDSTNGSLTLSHITCLGQVVYTSPFYGASLNDDELAIASMLKDISELSCTYSIQDAITDAINGRLL